MKNHHDIPSGLIANYVSSPLSSQNGLTNMSLITLLPVGGGGLRLWSKTMEHDLVARRHTQKLIRKRACGRTQSCVTRWSHPLFRGRAERFFPSPLHELVNGGVFFATRPRIWVRFWSEVRWVFKRLGWTSERFIFEGVQGKRSGYGRCACFARSFWEWGGAFGTSPHIRSTTLPPP